MLKLMRRLCAMAIFIGVGTSVLNGQLIELAYYHLGEDDAGATDGGTVNSTVDSIDGRDMETFGDLVYSNDTPGLGSSLSIAFDGGIDNYLLTAATPWHSLNPGFRVGMEGWVKLDAGMEGTLTVPFGNGTGYHLSIDEDGFPLANAGNRSTAPGETPIEYGEWQHVAF